MAENDIVINIRDNADQVSRNISSLTQQLNTLNRTLQTYSGQAQKLQTQTLDASKALQRSPGAIDLGFRNITKSAKESGGEIKKVRDAAVDLSSPSLRYALYDVGNSLQGLALGLAALTVAPVGFSIKYNREFANVIRTNQLFGDEVNAVKQSLIDIAQTTPISWGEITNIATLAGQLGIAQNLVAGFTETVAKFAATTDLTVEAAATAFGRLNQLIDGVDGEFEKLGSAILAVGVDSVATESQIVRVSTEIASMGNLAGLSAADIIGLSGAIASLGIRPELARGNITRLFSRIGRAVAEGGYELGEFGRLTGRTAQEFADAWASEPTTVLLDFFQGLQREGRDAEATLREIGITSVRDIPALLRLAQNVDEVRYLVGLSNKEFVLANVINEQYGIIANTTAEQLKRLTQNFELLLASLGTLEGPFASIIGFFNNLIESVTDFINTQPGQVFATIAGALGLLLTALVAFSGAAVTALAGASAFSLVIKQLNIDLTELSLKSLTSGRALDVLGLSALRQSASFRVLGASIKGAGIAFAAISAVLLVGGVLWERYAKQQELSVSIGKELFNNQQKLQQVLEEDKKTFQETGKFIRIYRQELEDANDEVRDSAGTSYDFIAGQQDLEGAVKKGSRALEEQAQRARDAADAYVVLGDSYAEYVKQQALESTGLVSLFEDPRLRELVTARFGGFEPFIDTIIGDPEAARTRVRTIIEQLKREVEAAGQTGIIDPALQAFVGIGPTADQIRVVEDYGIQLQGLINDVSNGTFAIDQHAEALAFVGGEYEETAYNSALAEGAVGDLMDMLFGSANAAKKAADSTQDYFAELAGGADAADLTSESLQNMVEAIAGNESRTAEQRVADLAYILSILEAQGLGSSAAALVLKQAIIEVANAAAGETIISLDNFDQKLGDIIAKVAPLLSLTGAVELGLKGVGTSAGGAASQVETLADKFDELLNSIFDPVNAAQDAAQAIYDLGASYAELGQDALYASDEVQDAVRNITASASSPEEAVANLNALFNELSRQVGSSTAPSLQFLRNTINALAAEFGVAADAVAGFANIDLSFFNDGVKSVQKEVRTLIDYANDLDEVISRAFDIRFATITQVDRLAESWDDLAQKINDAKETIDDLRQSQEDLSADRAIKQYFLSVAESYGDMLRAAQLRKELADLDKQQADNAAELAQAQAVAGGDLSGTGPGSRQNRGALIDLIGEYQSYITALAESGATQDELRAATAKARAEFIQQALELGFQETVVLEYAQAFDDVTTAINKVPRDITVDANVNPALQALNELNAALTDNIKSAVRLNQVLADRKQLDTKLPTKTPIVVVPAGTQTPVTVVDTATAMREFRRIERSGFASGGYTGAGGKYQPAGIVHKGEYVVPKQYVNQSSGLPNAQFLAQLQNGMRGYANGGFVGGSNGEAMMVELSPYDRKLLADAGNVQLRLNGRVVAEATNASNYSEARRGSN